MKGVTWECTRLTNRELLLYWVAKEESYRNMMETQDHCLLEKRCKQPSL